TKPRAGLVAECELSVPALSRRYLCDQLMQRLDVPVRCRERKDLATDHLGPVPAEELFSALVPVRHRSLAVGDDQADRQLVEQTALEACVGHRDVRKPRQRKLAARVDRITRTGDGL